MRKIYYFRSCCRSIARTKLLDMASPPTSVEDAALSQVFTDSGRLALQYQSMFKERLSEH